MPRDEGKLNVGIEYQFRVITYAAACLSENEDVENYEIYTNLKEMPGFDDLIIKVKHKTKNEYSAYLCQIKHSRKDLNINYKKHKLRHYKDFVDQIVNTKNEYPFLQDVSKDNLEFWIFTNAQFAWSPQKPLLLERDSHPPIECDISSIEHYKTIFPSLASTQCVKLTTRSVIEDHYFFDNFILLQCQPDNDRIRADITNLNTKIFSVDTVTKLIIFVYEYLSKSANSKRPNCLRKDIFETELLRLCLSSFIVPPKSAVDIHDDSANIWNIITLMHDVTVIDNDTINMVPFVFGCFWKKIKHFYDNTFDWYNCISNANKLSNASDLWKVIINLYQKIGVRHWTSVPDTLDSLLIELWKCDYLPLLLNTDCRISLLQKYAHLKKKFIILDTKQNKTNEIHRGYFKMFTSAADIINTPEGNQLISDLFISLQGRQPNNLLTIIGSDMDLARQLKSSHILHLTENKRLYLKMKYLPVNSSIVFLIEDDRSFQEINVGELQIQFNSNVTIYCKSSDIDMYTKLFTNSQRFKTYSICYLRESEEQFEYIGVDYRNVLTKEGAEIFQNPLRYVSNKFEHLTFSNFPASMYDNFLASLCAAYQHRRQLVLYIDSFDEVLPIYKQEVLKFVRCVFESNIRIIIASRFIANGLLLNNFEVQPVQIDRLDRNDVTSYFQEHDVSPDELAKIPRELLENPLYLTLLDILHEEGALTFKTINTFNLCKKVIEKKVELYYGRRGEHYNPETCQREDVLDIHKILAIAAIFGKETISKSEREYNTFVKKCNDGPIRLGIIVRFSDNYPIFLHHTYDNESLCDEARRKGLTRILDSVTSRYVITIDRKQQSQLQRKISLDGIMLDPSSL
ncbi:hypothetical protein QE152_g38805 [Popillia japonica]|uniref:Uncharacterized protein n=1 Tax=Popillia japonica TaxID=7064 RepID=A0AAW1HVZ2_POPJA